MYLTRRDSGYRFQIRIPSDLSSRIGKSPLRVNLGSIDFNSATRIARLLAGHTEKIFVALRNHGHPEMNIPDIRDLIISELIDIVAASIDDRIEILESAEKARQKAVKATELRLLTESHQQQAELQQRIKDIGERIRTVQGQVDIAGETGLAKVKNDLSSLYDAVKLSLEGGPQRPLLSQCLNIWTDEVRLHEGIDVKKVQTDKNRIDDFVAFAGDKPVNKYTYLDVQKFAILLAQVPANYNKLPALRGLNRAEAAEYNNKLPDDERLPTLVGKSIEDNYLSPLRMFFRDMAAEHNFRSPLHDVNIRIPKYARASKDRAPFEVPDLNRWFAYAAQQKRPDTKWLPLLGTITGARVAELIFLQGKDIYQMGADGGDLYWVIDLRTDLVDDDGTSQSRKLKTDSSHRLIALHEVFEELGFIRYAQDRRPYDYLFPGAFYHGKERVADPADAASKRMNSMLKKVGIHRQYEQTFHSTRHNAKDIMRLARIDERTHDLQTGHTLKTAVSRNYGKKFLRPEEMEVLSVMPLPMGLDLSPYLPSAGNLNAKK